MVASVAELIVRLQDEASKQAGMIAHSLDSIAKAERMVGAQSPEMNKLTVALQKAQDAARNLTAFQQARKELANTRSAFRAAQINVETLARAIGEIDAPTKKMQAEFARAQRAVKLTAAAFDQQKAVTIQAKNALGEYDSSLTRMVGSEDRVRQAIDETTAALKRQAEAEQLASRASQTAAEGHARLAARRRLRNQALGIVGMGGAMYAGEKATELVRGTLDTYKEFDDQRRFGGAVMGLTIDQQKPLIDQAIHLGGTTRFNDIQVLEAQRDLAARGVGMNAVLGMIPASATLGQGLDLSLPEAVKQLEGAIFGFKKDVSSVEAATLSAQQTADLQVKAAKISGMTPEDITGVYKYGATPARLSGVSEETLLAFGGISKKANMGGDESGVAFRALMAAAQSPTRGAKEALLANGLDYKNYQRNPDSIALDPFIKNVAAQYGVALNEAARAGLGKIFSDKSLISDPSKFTPAVMDVLGDTLGGDDAKSKRSIAGMANRFRSASMQGVDVNQFIADLMAKIPGNLQLANAIFGSKQGGRIATALGDPTTFTAMRGKLENDSAGFAQTVSDERQGGFAGASDRLAGSMKNLETAIGRSMDAGGAGGFLTGATDTLAKWTQRLAESNPNVLAFGSALGVAGSKVAEFTSAWGLVNNLLEFRASTALTTAAGELSLAAGAITRAAGAEAAGGALGGAGSKGAGAMGFLGKLGIWGGTLAAGLAISDYIPHPKWLDQTPGEALEKMGIRPSASTLRGTFGQPLPGQSPSVDTKSIDAAKDKASDASAAVDTLNKTVAPTVDTTSIDAAIAKLKQLNQGLSTFTAGEARAATSVDQQVRAVHADTGIAAGAAGSGW